MRDRLMTARLELRALASDDVADLHALFSDPRTHTFRSGPVADVAETATWIERSISRRRECGVTWYGIRRRDEPDLIGNVGLFIGRTGDEPELGMEIRYEDQGSGYATEPTRAVLEEAWNAGFYVVWATARAWNAASLAVLDHLGFGDERTEGFGPDALVYRRRPGPG